MYLELVDSLRCIAEHEASSLVATVDARLGRAIVTGTLGCPVCGARYRISDGVADFTDLGSGRWGSGRGGAGVVPGTEQRFGSSGLASAGTEQGFGSSGLASAGTEQGFGSSGLASAGTEQGFGSSGLVSAGTEQGFGSSGLASPGTEQRFGSSGLASPPPRSDPNSGDKALRLAAQLHLRDPGGIVLLAGRHALLAEPLMSLVDVTLVLLDGSGPAAPHAAAKLRVHDRLPFAGGGVRAIALDDADRARSLVRDAVRALRPAGRIVAPAVVVVPDGVRELARDATEWVGERVEPLVALRR